MAYNVEDLINIFKEHSIKFEKNKLEDQFNLCDALLVMCEEIKKLKEARNENGI